MLQDTLEFMQTSFMHPCSASAYLQNWPFPQEGAAYFKQSKPFVSSWTDIWASRPISTAHPNPCHCYLLGPTGDPEISLRTFHQPGHTCWHIAARDCISALPQA